jgi:hypothetical protein
VPSPLDLGTGGTGDNLPGIDERVTALEEYQTVQDEAIAQTRNELEASIEENKGILPVGMEYIRLTGQTPYPGGVDYLGQEATRAMYADLWTWKNKHKPESIISEEAWQAMYASQNGNVPFFSTGDGSTTFRFPRSVGYLKIAGTVGEIGAYKAEGLPDHTHTRGTMNITGSQQLSAKRFPNAIDSSRTALYSSTTSSSGYFSTGSDSTSGITTINLDASRSWTGETSPASESNAIYGNSSHVTPESMTVVMGVIAISVTGALGEATEEGIVQELSRQGAELADLDERKADASALASKVSSINGTMIFDLENGSTIELRRAGDAGAYTLSVVYIAEDGTKKFGVLMNSEGEFLPGAFYAPNLSAGVGISASTTYTVPSNGFLIAHVCSSNTARMDLTINGATLGLSQDDTGHDQICIPVKKGDTVSWRIASGNMNWTKTVTFYPAR